MNISLAYEPEHRLPHRILPCRVVMSGTCRALSDEGVTLESRDATGNTALHHACEAGYLECVRALLSRDVPPADTEDVVAMTITKAMLSGEQPRGKLVERSTRACHGVRCWVLVQLLQ